MCGRSCCQCCNRNTHDNRFMGSCATDCTFYGYFLLFVIFLARLQLQSIPSNVSLPFTTRVVSPRLEDQQPRAPGRLHITAFPRPHERDKLTCSSKTCRINSPSFHSEFQSHIFYRKLLQFHAAYIQNE